MNWREIEARFWDEEDEMETLEWAILGGIIIVAAGVATLTFGSSIANLLNGMANEVHQAEDISQG